MLNRRNLLTRAITATLVWLGLKPADAAPVTVKVGRSPGKSVLSESRPPYDPQALLEFRVSGPWVDIYKGDVCIAMIDDAYGEPCLLATGEFTRLTLAEMARCLEFYQQHQSSALS